MPVNEVNEETPVRCGQGLFWILIYSNNADATKWPFYSGKWFVYGCPSDNKERKKQY
jgi:hypothetical protein